MIKAIISFTATNLQDGRDHRGDHSHGPLHDGQGLGGRGVGAGPGLLPPDSADPQQGGGHPLLCQVSRKSLTKYDLIIECFSDSLETGFALVSVIVSLLLPAVVGPLLSLIVLLLTSCIFLWTRVKYSEVNKQ